MAVIPGLTGIGYGQAPESSDFAFWLHKKENYKLSICNIKSLDTAGVYPALDTGRYDFILR